MAETCPECGNQVQTWDGYIYPHGTKEADDEMPKRCPGSGLPELSRDAS